MGYIRQMLWPVFVGYFVPYDLPHRHGRLDVRDWLPGGRLPRCRARGRAGQRPRRQRCARPGRHHAVPALCPRTRVLVSRARGLSRRTPIAVAVAPKIWRSAAGPQAPCLRAMLRTCAMRAARAARPAEGACCKAAVRVDPASMHPVPYSIECRGRALRLDAIFLGCVGVAGSHRASDYRQLPMGRFCGLLASA